MLTDEVRNYVLLLHIYRRIVKGDTKIFESHAGGSKEVIVKLMVKTMVDILLYL